MIASGPHAVYLQDAGGVLAVLGRYAAAVPCGLRTQVEQLPPTDAAVIGGGHCLLGNLDVVVRRVVDTRVPSLGPIAAHAWPCDTDLEAATCELPADALQRLGEGDAAAVGDLLGRGSGLTPTGDDVLAGWLVTAGATGLDHAGVASAVAAHAPSRTTAISAALLHAAVRGEAIPQLRILLLALRSGIAVPQALRRLLAVGHTSGAGLALGVRLALHQARPRRHP